MSECGSVNYWNILSGRARDTMRELGNFGPTVNVNERMVKGYMLGDDSEAVKVYFSSSELRAIAQDLIEVAECLDKRADGT